MMTLRSAQRATTERSIIEAVHRVLVEEHPASLSMPRVADAAGVSLRTLYRYFPTKAELVDAASRSYEVEVNAEVDPPDDLAALESYLIAMWRTFDESVPAVLAQHLTPAGRELRSRRLPRSRAHLRRVLHDQAPHLDEATAERLVDTVAWLTSSASYLELTQHLGHRSDEAARIVTDTVRAIVAQQIGRTP